MDCRKPVIAAVNGPALAGGLVFVASADIILMAESAVLGLPEIDVGLLGGARHAMRLFGHSRTPRMVLTGFRVTAQEAYRLGITEACLPPPQLMSAALEIARSIAAKSPAAVARAKRGLNVIADMPLREGYIFEQSLTAELAEHADSAEAMRAFVERRDRSFS
jgi:enoyl-CoA hydratase